MGALVHLPAEFSRQALPDKRLRGRRYSSAHCCPDSFLLIELVFGGEGEVISHITTETWADGLGITAGGRVPARVKVTAPDVLEEM